ncbi:uncharacterized protein LOC132059742 [Lycium ferocissimum]|uniref:uncharacterized protein LOC132059742 n=1 Tax=Lycium ferocissimum TaxID=112874 RepID=UPI002814D37B|nr:uncharacterized protein LOC132059742 [Lycium ferocissimum]
MTCSGYFASYSSRVTSSWQQRRRKPPNLLVQNDGLSSTNHTIQGPEKTNDLTDDKGPRSCPLPGTDRGSNSCSKLPDQISIFDKAFTYSLPQHDQGTIVPAQHVERSTVTGRQKATNNVASDQGFTMRDTKSQPTRLPPHLPSNTSIGPHKPNSGVIREKILDEPTGICSFDWHEHSTMLTSHGQQKVPPELEHDEQTMVPPLSSIYNDDISVNHHHHAWDLPSSHQLPSVEGENKDTGFRDRKALEKYVLVDQDYAYDGDSPSGSDVEGDQDYMTFLAHAWNIICS